MKTTRTTILDAARTAGDEAAAREYDALTPETARKLRSDIVPDYAADVARAIVAAAFGLDSEDVRGTRIAQLATETWSRAFRAAWPAEDVARLAMSIEPDGFDFEAHRATYEDMSEEALFARAVHVAP